VSRAFAEGNRLWFDEGRTARALRRYQQAARERPEDAAVAFQYAVALWAVDRFAEAAAMVDRARRLAHRLGEPARETLEIWLPALEDPSPPRHFPEFPPAELDRDRLSGDQPDRDWRAVAFAAAERMMYGVAAYALQRWGGAPIDAEAARDLSEISSREGALRHAVLAIQTSRRDHGPRPAPRRPSPPNRPEHPAGQLPRPLAPGPPATSAADPSGPRLHGAHQPRTQPAPTDARTASVPDGQASGPESTGDQLPLTFEVQVLPVEAPVGSVTHLKARIGNPTTRTVQINSRMIINHPGAPGELLLDLDGPPGYVNSAGFRVNVGPLDDGSVTLLQPGQSMEWSWPLERYWSIDTPGEYVLKATYHNETSRAPDGRRVLVGQISASTTFRRQVTGP
jgi:hypothetical protein